MKYGLEFLDKYGDIKELGEFDTVAEAWKFMSVFVKANHLPKIYYTRCWDVVGEDGVKKMKVDYGSHYSFFYITNYSMEDMMNEQRK